MLFAPATVGYQDERIRDDLPGGAWRHFAEATGIDRVLEEEDEQSFQRGDINGDGVVDQRDFDPEAFRPTTEVGARTAADLPERIDVDDD